MPTPPDKYINQTLLDGLQVFEKFLTDLSPFAEYSVQALADLFNMDYSKVFRIVKTLHHAGYIETNNSGNSYCISKKILHLPLRYLNALRAEHEKIKHLVNSFTLNPGELYDTPAIPAQQGRAAQETA